MMIDHILTYTFPAAYALLPAVMRSEQATANLVAIGLHESGFRARRQYNLGAAHGFWQFERVGLRDVLEHPRTATVADVVIDALCYKLSRVTTARQSSELFEAITHNDPLACCMARLNLWKLPKPLAGQDDPETAWQQYLTLWKPGAYTRGTADERQRLRASWSHSYAEAWARVTAAS